MVRPGQDFEARYGFVVYLEASGDNPFTSLRFDNIAGGDHQADRLLTHLVTDISRVVIAETNQSRPDQPI